MDHNLATLKNAFASPRAFYDDANFPRGFGRSGHFTLQKAEILERCGATLRSLYSKAEEPQNSFQSQFVQVMEGLIPPTNAVEKAWTKYLKHTTCKTKFHTLFGRSKVQNDGSVVIPVDIDDEL
ncbi:DUF413 domain-containing protein [Pseudoalteromonas piscicida]|uniref:Macrodomain Ori protein n=1 Tax=Pseudoalteromonas piscicida TaxID=43662 RepID=A0ABN5CL63_PSEO7|nr:DUF413 domain-containing protein [Pseudoalteromonas piscicida]ATD07741.1 hypothetical protein PPIS_a2848 [Pseudoalteromonas piscicida]WPU34336.1 DUF413 domain-containing protein [Pseudoalteromonas piscicida]